MAIMQPLLLERLNHLLDTLWKRNAFYASRWREAGVSSQPLTSLEELSRYPCVTRKDFEADQAQNPPLGSHLTFPLPHYNRVHRSSGTSGSPIVWADTPESWDWLITCSAELFRKAGVASSDRVFLSAPFGPSLGSWVLREGASRGGCLCFASGAAPLDEQLFWLRKFACNVLVSKPAQVLSLASTAEELNMMREDFRVQKVITVGAPGGSDPSVRQQIRDFWRAEVFDRYGMTEAGSIAGECVAHPGGLHLLDGEFIAEVLEPHAETPVPDGEPGELVLTNLGRVGSPLVRYRTGDVVRVVRNYRCACGETGTLMGGGIRRKEARR
jgi:phenylacetate-CoA ligase